MSQAMHIGRLEEHPRAYVTIGELAQYWGVSRKQIYKHVEVGTLHALRFGPRSLRIPTSEARRFEDAARIVPLDEQERIKAQWRAGWRGTP